jgi:uncharacterized membrane protein
MADPVPDPELPLEERIAKELEPKIVEKVTRVVREFTYSGPLPPAAELLRYKQVLENAPERILKMVEDQSNHRIKIEDKISSAQVRQSDKAQWMAFTLAILFGGAGLWVTLAGHEAVGGLFGGGTVVALVTTFIVGKNQEKRSLESKRQNLGRIGPSEVDEPLNR